MAFDNPLGFFQAGQQATGKSPWEYGAGNVLDLFHKQQELQNQVGAQASIENYKQQLLNKYEPERKGLEVEKELKAKGDYAKNIFQTLGLNGAASGGSPGAGSPGGMGGFAVSEIDPLTGDVKMKNVGLEQQIKRNESIQKGAGAEAGKIALAQESIQNIRDMKKILFPDGTAKSFNRMAAGKANLPIIGGPLPFDEEGQTLFRKGGAALAARQLIQTGVAARPEETKALVRQFMANSASNPKAAFKALDELENFYGSYLGTTDPTNMFHGDVQRGPSGTAPAASANSGSLDIEQERKDALDEIAKRPNQKDYIMAEFKRVTGQDLS